MRRLPLPLLVALALAVAPARAAVAQRTRVEVALPARDRLTTEGPQVRATGVLGDRQLQELMRSGFPTRMRFRLELWSDDGVVDDLRGTREWDIIVRFDPLDRTYRIYEVVGKQGGGPVGSAPAIAGARELVERWRPVPLVTRRRGRYYYTVALDVETLSLTDLDELERWLRGELQPAGVNPVAAGNALTRGFRTLMARLLGGERAVYDARTPKFEVR